MSALLSKINVSWTGQSWAGAAARLYRQRFGKEARWFDDLMRRRRRDGRDALPCDPRQDVRWLISGAAPLIVYAFRRVRRSTSTAAFQTCDAGRARVQLPSEAGTPDMTIGPADADRAGAGPYLRRQPRGSVLFF